MDARAAQLAELRDSLGRMELALDTIDEALVWTDARGTVEWCNRSFEKLAGRPRIECLGRLFDDILSLRPEAGAGGSPVDILRSSGALPARVFVSKLGDDPVISVQGRVLPSGGREMAFVLRDITSARRAERALSRLAAIVDSSDDAILSEDVSGRIVTWNEGARRLYGYEAREAVGQHISIVVPDDRLEELEQLRSRVRAGETIVGLETVRRSRTGDLIDVSLTISPIKIGGQISGYSVIVRDIGKMKALVAELKMKNEELDAFAYSVAHDLRAPLRQIDGWTTLLSRGYGPSLDDRGRDLLSRLGGATRRLGELVTGLLELSRLSRIELHVTDMDISETARQIARQLAAADPTHAPAFDIKTGLAARADPTLLRNMLYNLIENAWKFTRNKEAARIEVGYDASRGAFYVRDNGVGFDMAHAGKLFRPFERLHSGSEFPGTGVGLAGVKRFVERHGGRIWADAEPGRGAAFYFTLGPDDQARTKGTP